MGQATNLEPVAALDKPEQVVVMADDLDPQLEAALAAYLDGTIHGEMLQAFGSVEREFDAVKVRALAVADLEAAMLAEIVIRVLQLARGYAAFPTEKEEKGHVALAILHAIREVMAAGG